MLQPAQLQFLQKKKKKVHSSFLFFVRIWIISWTKSITSNISVDFNEQQAIDSLIYALALWWDVIRDKDIKGGVGWESVPAQDCMLSLVLSLTQQLREEHQVDNPGAAALQKQAYSWTWEDLFCRGEKSRMGTIDKNLSQIFPANCHVPPGKSTYLFPKKFGQRFQILGRRRWCFVKDSLWSLSESFWSQDSHTLPHFCLWTDCLETIQKRLC